MAQVEFDSLIREALSAVPACPRPTIVRNILNAAIDLAEKTGCMRYELEGDLAIADLPEVEFSLPQDTVLVKPVALEFNGVPLTPTSVRIMNKDRPEWKGERAPTPKHYLRAQNTLNAVRLYPIPDVTGAITGEVAVKPTRDAEGIEDIYMDRFFTALVDGMLGRLLAISSAPWYSPSVADHHMQRFYAQFDEATRVADADDVPKLRTVRYGGM